MRRTEKDANSLAVNNEGLTCMTTSRDLEIKDKLIKKLFNLYLLTPGFPFKCFPPATNCNE